MKEKKKEEKKNVLVAFIIMFVGLLFIFLGIGYSLVFDKSDVETSKNNNEIVKETTDNQGKEDIRSDDISEIENSRRDEFAIVAQNYLNIVRNSVLADEIKCKDTSTDEWKRVSSFGDGKYYFLLATDSSMLISGLDATIGKNVLRQTSDLMEFGGKSSWDDAEIAGFVYWEKIAIEIGTKNVFKIALADSTKHGIPGSFEGDGAEDQNITRSLVATGGVEIDLNAIYIGATATTEKGETPVYYCELYY